MKKLVLIMGLAGVVLGLAGCHHEQPVVKAIRTASAQVNQGNVTGALTWIDDDFGGNDGEVNKDRLKNLMLFTKVDQRLVKVEPSDFKVKQYPEFTQVLFKLRVTSNNAAIGRIFQGETYLVNSTWNKRNGQWRCQLATWHLEPGQ